MRDRAPVGLLLLLPLALVAGVGRAQAEPTALTPCLEATERGDHALALTLCQAVVAQDRTAINVAALANVMVQTVAANAVAQVDLGQALALLDEANRLDPSADYVWAVRAEAHALLGDRELMEEAVSHLAWDSAEDKRTDCAYYEYLLERAGPVVLPDASSGANGGGSIRWDLGLYLMGCLGLAARFVVKRLR